MVGREPVGPVAGNVAGSKIGGGSALDSAIPSRNAAAARDGGFLFAMITA